MWELTIKLWYGKNENLRCTFENLEKAINFIEIVSDATQDDFEFVLRKKKGE